ncbi:TlpA disulfide reductase family protein [Chitinophaga sp. Cy-1792]|uniref:TlpA disulfide reductase family protein n=1 Tax=Chitinophaga sp. Cy-1792 TaxID=2608339 RepID=UPI00141DDEC4|nr:TlpA disulfide reductase family protein [Chitinophaga sp. Cy-1792]NIG57559.1 redoxin domain-containing protein [Chitinophaga sp. Cy-1792]
MKRLIPILLCGGLLTAGAAGAQQKNNADTLQQYYRKLAMGNDQDKALLENKMYALLKTAKKEDDYSTAANMFFAMKKNKISDSILVVAKKRYPAGALVRTDSVQTVYNEKDPVKKEALYKAWVKKFPPEKFGPDRIVYDYARNSVASEYAVADNVAKAVEYANMTETDVWKGEGWAGVANRLAKNKHYTEAAELMKKAIDLSYSYRTVKKDAYGAQFAATGYPGYLSSYVNMLFEQKQYDSALVYIKRAIDAENPVRPGVNETYAKILLYKGDYAEAFSRLSAIGAAGMLNGNSKKMLEEAYAKVRGNGGFDAYVDSLKGGLDAKMREEFAAKIINETAPDFVLKDVDGNTVKLSDLKGKTVVLDFWATWCGPCKASFPAMKKAQEKFKNDPNVKFLFVHTWEKDDKAIVNAKQFVTSNNYPFEVLMDLKDPATGVNKVVESYKVTGIPTKFVIDKAGNIRFRFTGFSGGDDAAVAEVAAMISLAK